MPLDGTLADMSLPNLVQLQCSEHKRAQVQLTRSEIEGTLVFADGDMLHATVGPLEGEQAVYELLGWDDGLFHVSEDVDELPVRNITIPWQTLMLEGLRRKDENRSEHAQIAASAAAQVERISGVAAWHVCTIDGLEMNATGECTETQVGEWTKLELVEGSRLAQILGMGPLKEMNFFNSINRRLVVSRDRYWLTLDLSSSTPINSVRDALLSK